MKILRPRGLTSETTQHAIELGGKQLKAQEGFQLYTTKLNTVNALRWSLSSKGKSAVDAGQKTMARF